jgi:hypothetical protein
VKYPVYLAADRRDGRADSVRGVEVFRPDDLADPRDLVGYENAPAADGDQRAILLGGLHPVDRVPEHPVRLGQRRGEEVLVLGDPPDAQRRPAGHDRAVRQRGRVPAEDQRLALQQVANAARAEANAVTISGNHRAAAKGDRDQVRHPEVGADASDLDSIGGFAGKPVDQHADVRGGAADVDHQGIRAPGEESGAADAVGGAAADREHRVPQRLVEAHQRAVVLREERYRPQVVRGERVLHRAAHVARDSGQGAVEYRRVLPLQESYRADLVAERHVHVPELALDHVGGR